MKIRQYAAFKADFPSDTFELDDGTLRMGGRGVASAIAGLLTDQGYIVSGPDYAGDHGWEVYVEPYKRRFWIQVSDADEEILLQLADCSRLFPRSKWASQDAYPKFLQDLHAVLVAEPRFSEIRWYNQDYNGRERSTGAEPLIEDGSAEVRL